MNIAVLLNLSPRNGLTAFGSEDGMANPMGGDARSAQGSAFER